MTTTVVICSYNYGPFVAQAIDSVLGQTKVPDDVVFVDDCSDEFDQGLGVARAYGLRTVARYRNLGIVDNFDDVLRNHVHTDRVMYLGADNYLRPDTLHRLSVADDDVDIVSYDLALVGDKANSSRIKRKYCKWDPELGYYVREFASTNAIRTRNEIHGSALYNVKLAIEVGGYKPLDAGLEGKRDAKRPQEDWSLWQRMIRQGKAKRIHIPEPFLYYRRHSLNFSGNY